MRYRQFFAYSSWNSQGTVARKRKLACGKYFYSGMVVNSRHKIVFKGHFKPEQVKIISSFIILNQYSISLYYHFYLVVVVVDMAMDSYSTIHLFHEIRVSFVV